MGTAEKEKKNVAKGFQPLGERVFVTYTEAVSYTHLTLPTIYSV